MSGTKKEVQKDLLDLLKELNSVCDSLDIKYRDDFDINELEKILQNPDSEGERGREEP